MKKLLLAACILSLLTVPAVVQAQYNYTTNSDNTITITGYTGSGGAVTLPSSLGGLPVTSIGYGAFQYCTNLSSFAIPNSVTIIGGNAFFGCMSLTSITIPNSVTNIGLAAFIACANLSAITVGTKNLNYSSMDGVLFNKNQTTLIQCPGGKGGSYTLPDSVTNIVYGAFIACAKLSAITVGTNNLDYSSMDGVLFNKNQTTLIQCPEGKGGSYTLPDSVTNIVDGAFQICANLTSVTIPTGVTKIDRLEFEGCTNLTSVTLPDSVTSIGAEAFYLCHSLTSVTIPNSVTNIDLGAFHYCTSLTSITIPNSVTGIGYSAFAICTNLNGIYFSGNAPGNGSDWSVFAGDNKATVYYLLGTTGWGPTFGGRPTALWTGQSQVIVNVTANPSNGGTVSGGGTYLIGTNVQIAASANSGWTFTGWSDGGEQTHNITVPAGGAMYTANFSSYSTFQIGARVVANPTASYPHPFVHDQTLRTILFTQITGVHGTIVGGPNNTSANGFNGNWWEISWDSEPPDQNEQPGWSAEPVIALAPLAGDVPEPDFTNSFYAPVPIGSGKNTSSANIFVWSGNAPTAAKKATGFGSDALGNCTWYAYGRLLELGYSSSQLGAIALPNGNAYQWAINAARSSAKALGVTVDGTPTTNSIAQKTFSSKAGHVAVVESVNTDGTITVTESSYSNDTASVWNFLWHHRTCATNWFSNYIHVTLPPTIATTSLVNATSNVTYTATLHLNPGTGIPQFKWSWVVQSGSKLPSVAGISLNPTTGVISGVPKKTGTFSFTMKVTDAKKQTATQPLTLTITAAP